EAADDVRLLEVRMVSVEDQRLFIEVLPHDPGEARIPALSHPGGVVRSRRFRGVVVDVVMLRAEDAKIERLVLDRVASDLLDLDPGRRNRCHRGNEHHRPRSCTREPTHLISVCCSWRPPRAPDSIATAGKRHTTPAHAT